MDYVKNNAWYGGEEIANMPENNLPTDMLEFVNGGTRLKVHAIGDMAKYFRDAVSLS